MGGLVGVSSAIQKLRYNPVFRIENIAMLGNDVHWVVGSLVFVGDGHLGYERW
jgi:hypothetical protein